MSGFVRVKPGPGRRVRDAQGKFVPAAGMRVERGLYIQRRIDAGDLVVIDESDGQRTGAPARKGK